MLKIDQDAKKMPPLVQPRAEKRKLIEEELNCSLKVSCLPILKCYDYFWKIWNLNISVATEAPREAWFRSSLARGPTS